MAASIGAELRNGELLEGVNKPRGCAIWTIRNICNSFQQDFNDHRVRTSRNFATIVDFPRLEYY